MSRERALLRRLVEAWRDGGEASHSFEVLTQVLREAKALLAEPEGEALDPRTEYERFIVGWVAQHAPEVSERAGAAYREVASRPTPRSRAEAEAMLKRYDESVVALQEGPMEALVPDAAEFDDARAALLAALTHTQERT